MKVQGNELPMDDGRDKMIFVKMFPAETDSVSNMPEVSRLPQ